MLDHYNLLVIAPLFFAYTLGSFTSLRAWIAVRELPPAVPIIDLSTPSPEAVLAAKNRRQNIVFHAAFMLVMIALAICAAATAWWFGDSKTLLAIETAVIIVLCSLLSLMALFDLFGFPLAYHRTREGGLLKLPEEFNQQDLSTKKITISAVLFGIALLFGASRLHSDICASAMVFLALLAIEGYYEDAKIVRFRRVMIDSVVYACLAAAATTVLYGLNNTAKSKEGPPLYGQDQSQWVYVFWLAFPPSELFGICLRFDFSIHVDAADSAALSTRLEALPAPAVNPGLALSQQLGTKPGVVAPSYAALAAVRFPCPYFGSALAVWLCANLVVFMLGLRGFAAEYGHEAHACGVLLLAPPSIVGTTIAVALARGEIKQLLEYEEVWTYEPISQGGRRKICPL